MEKDVHRQFTRWLPDILTLTEDLVKIESGTGTVEGIEGICQLLKPYFTDLGLTCREEPTQAGPVLIAAGEKPRFLFMGHMDTVFPKGTIQKNPFRVEGGKAFGPGVIDMKSGIASIIFVLKALSHYSDLHQEICILLNPDEEISSPYSRPLIEKEAQKVEGAFVFEPTKKLECITTRRKGVGSLRLNIRGRAAHAGSSPEEGLSANRELARCVLEMEELTDLEQGITVNVGRMEGGTTRNTIPEEAWGHMDLRFWTQAEGEELVNAITAITNKGRDAGYEKKLEGGITRPPMHRTKESQVLFTDLKRSGMALGISLQEVEAGGVSDANFISAVGTPVLDSLGPVGNRAHSLDEYLEIESIPLKASLVTCTLLGLEK